MLINFSILLLQDLSNVFLPLLSSAILRGLQDVDDDVRAVAASSLLPVANQLHLIIPEQACACQICPPSRSIGVATNKNYCDVYLRCGIVMWSWFNTGGGGRHSHYVTE